MAGDTVSMDAIRTAHFGRLMRAYPLNKRVYVIYLVAGLVALLPLRLYVSGQRWWLLPLLAVPILAVGCIGTLRAVRIAAATMLSDWKPGATAQALVIGQWRSLTRYIWRRTAPLTLLKLGLAFGLAQWLHNVQWALPAWQVGWLGSSPNAVPFRCEDLLLNGNICYYTTSSWQFLSPVWWQLLLGGLILAVFTYLESALLAAIALSVGQRIERVWQRVGLIVVIRLLLAGFGLLTWTSLWRLDDTLALSKVRDSCFWVVPGCEEDTWDRQGNNVSETMNTGDTPNGRRFGDQAELNIVGVLLEHQRLAAWTSIDGGVLVAANTMRPGFGLIYLMYTNISFVLFSVGAYIVGINMFISAAILLCMKVLSGKKSKIEEEPSWA